MAPEVVAIKIDHNNITSRGKEDTETIAMKIGATQLPQLVSNITEDITTSTSLGHTLTTPREILITTMGATTVTETTTVGTQ